MKYLNIRGHHGLKAIGGGSGGCSALGHLPCKNKDSADMSASCNKNHERDSARMVWGMRALETDTNKILTCTEFFFKLQFKLYLDKVASVFGYVQYCMEAFPGENILM